MKYRCNKCALAQATPLLQHQMARTPGEFTYEPQIPKMPVTQDSMDHGLAKACR